MARWSLHKQVGLRPVSESLLRRLFRAAADTLDIPSDLQFSVVVVADDRIQQLNAHYRHKNMPTDVLSFRYDDTMAEIVLGADTIRRQAVLYHNSVTEESAFMIVHGILHCLGWDHERSAAEDREQRALEVTILSLCGLKCAR